MDVTSKLQLLGNPFIKSTFAKNVWDMQVFNGHIYLGHGDFNTNEGPIPVIYYDPAASKFVTHFTVDEEEISTFKVYNDKLFIPGTDAREDWTFGNFYIVSLNNSYIKKRTIPNANHIFDIAYYNGQLYAATGTNKNGWGEVLSSKDMGDNWTTQIPPNSSSVIFTGSWAMNLFELNNKLCAVASMLFPSKYTASQLARYTNLLEMDGTTSVIKPYPSSFAPGASTTAGYRMKSPTTFNNSLVFLECISAASHWNPDSMYVATGLSTSRKITFPESTTKPGDIFVRDNTLYVLGNIQISSKSYTNIVYKSVDLKTWTEVLRFNMDTFSRSFEELNGDFYFGLGCDADYLSTNTGNILKVAKETY